LQLNP